LKETPNPDERETLQIMSNINFQALQATPGGPGIPEVGRLSYFSDSSGTDGGPNMRYTFDQEKLMYSESEQDKLRNFKP